MEIQINEKNARAMAERLRSCLGNEQVSQAKSLETLAKTLGFRNWDTLAAKLKDNQQDPSEAAVPAFKLAKPVTLFVDAFCCDEFGEGPNWAKVVIDQAFLDKLDELQALCVNQGLSEARVRFYPEEWQGDLRIECDELVVDKTSWWFHGLPKHCNFAVETRMIDISALKMVLRMKVSTDYLAWYQDVLVYDPSGNTFGQLEQIVDDGGLPESYLL